MLFKIGIGEVPLLQQVTFSIWPDTASMAAFARADGPHARAIRAVREGGWFSRRTLCPVPRRLRRTRHLGGATPARIPSTDDSRTAAECRRMTQPLSPSRPSSARRR